VRPDDLETLTELRSATTAVLTEAIGHGATVALLDAPNQRNVGDSLIWVGELEYFRTLGLRLAYVADRRTYDAAELRRALPPDGVILIHGGGNFGDLWDGHQQHREQVARDFPDRKIVQLPQSVWFESPEKAALANAVLGGHPDFTLLVRDSESEGRAAAQLPDVRRRYCWDMALGWSAPTRASAAAPGAAPVLVIARTDHEGSSGLGDLDLADEIGAEVHVADWTSAELDTLSWRLARLVPRAAHRYRFVRGPLLRPLVNASFRWINAANIRGGIRLYRDRRYAIVDRLHAHVLAVLLDLDHVLLDNNYGKLGAVYRDYSSRFSTASYADRPQQAVELAAEALGRARAVR